MGYRTNLTTSPSALAAADAASGRSWCYAYDGNGNVSAVVDLADGTKVGRYEYDAFGRTIASWGDEGLAEVNQYRFSTKPVEGTGWYYYGYRWYEPENGRWLGRDPIGEEGGVNLYGFVGNDGVNRGDFLGLDFIAVGFQKVGFEFIGYHASIVYFKAPRCVMEGTKFKPSDIGRKFPFDKAVQVDARELLPSHHQYKTKATTPQMSLPGNFTIPSKDVWVPVSISFITKSTSASDFEVVYSDIEGYLPHLGQIDTLQKWESVTSASDSFPYAESGVAGKATLTRWPNSRYNFPLVNSPVNNSNTFIHEMLRAIGRKMPSGWNLPGDTSPSPVTDSRPTPILW